MNIDWNNVVSPNRNEIVFSGRNQEYGAYEIRKNYTHTVALTIAGVALGCVLLFGAKMLFDMKAAADAAKEARLDDTQIELTPPPLDEKEPPPPPPPPPPPVVETVKFVPPVIKEDAREDEPPPPQEKLNDTQVATQTQEGNGDDNVVVPTETGTGPVEEKVEIFTVVEEMPKFPGGDAELLKYIQKNVQYPQIEKEAGISGRCYIKFVIEADGGVSNVEIARGVTGGAALDKEAVRVVKSMPKWSIGKQNGRAVRVMMNLPINFQLK